MKNQVINGIDESEVGLQADAFNRSGLALFSDKKD